MEPNEWTHVVSKRGSLTTSTRKQSNKHHTRDKLAVQSDTEDDETVSRIAEETVTSCIKLCAEVEKSGLFESIVESLEKSNFTQLSEVVSLGIGKVCSSPSSLLQLAMASSLRKYELSSIAIRSTDECDRDQKIAKIILGDDRATCTIYDPMFTAKELKVCEALGFAVSAENLKGKHQAVSGSTLFFMPHCPHRLYINLLWANWNRLDNLIILGNR